MRRSRYEELVRSANHHGEGSARLYLAGEYANALVGCGHSVDALEALLPLALARQAEVLALVGSVRGWRTCCVGSSIWSGRCSRSTSPR